MGNVIENIMATRTFFVVVPFLIRGFVAANEDKKKYCMRQFLVKVSGLAGLQETSIEEFRLIWFCTSRKIVFPVSHESIHPSIQLSIYPSIRPSIFY